MLSVPFPWLTFFFSLSHLQIVDGEAEELESFAENFGKLRQIKPESSIILLDS